jgi:TPR repeat protein/peroxiredoxin
MPIDLLCDIWSKTEFIKVEMTRTYWSFFLVSLLLSFAQFSYALTDSTHFDKGMAHYLRLQYTEAGLHFMEASKQNVAEAFTMLAMMHYRGQGLPQDSEMAVKLAKEGVSRGDKKALYVQGMVWLDKTSEAYNPAADSYFVKAIPAMQEAASRGSIFWKTRLAYCYGNGLGVVQNFKKAIDLYEQAAAANYAIAFHGLGYIYLNGRGVEIDYEKALLNFRRAVALGLVKVPDGMSSEAGIYDVAYAYHHGQNNLPQDLTQAMALYAESAVHGYGPAYTGMGKLLNQNFPKAKEYLEKGIAAGDGEAATELALHYLESDTAKCRYYYELALQMKDDSGWPEAGLSHLYKSNANKSQHYAFQALMKGAPAQYVFLPELVLGQLAPDFTLPNVDGQLIKLSSLRGNYVLIDFWASWCGPCREENPNIVRAYSQYKDKGLKVLSVSLDNDKDRWRNAIAKDNLTWHHVSDLQGWNSPVAKLYNVLAIPQNFLIDKDGRLIAIDLHGETLLKKLEATIK